jgi:hypothetical protein
MGLDPVPVWLCRCWTRGDGQSRIVVDDVRCQNQVRATAWDFDAVR